jgi:hypothetical protein
MHDSQNRILVDRKTVSTVTKREIVLVLLTNFISGMAVPISNKNSKAVYRRHINSIMLGLLINFISSKAVPIGN